MRLCWYHCVSVANVLLFVTVEAAVQNLTLTTLNNSEVLTTWNVADLFELSFFNVSYFIKSELQGTKEVTVNTYQISDLIPGETYTVAVTAYYNKVFPSATIEKAVMLARIGILFKINFMIVIYIS